MKKLLCLAVLISVFVFTSTVAASEPVPPYDPPVVPVNQTLLDKYKEFFPPKVITVTDGVYVANGYNRDNPTLIEGPNGLIVVDPGESIEAGQKARAAFNAALDNIFDKKPVKAIIYTHDHDCHVNGAKAFAGPQTEIIGHVDLMSSLYSEWFGQVFPSRAEGGVKMAGLLFMDAPVKPNPDTGNWEGWYAGYVLGAAQWPGPEGFLPPTRTISDDTKLSIAGVQIELIPVAGEAQDVLLVWLPQKKVLIQIAILYEAFPALATMRGSRLRDPLDYVKSLKICRSLNPDYLVALHGPTPVTRGAANVRQYLTNFSDAIQFLNDQTVQYLNKGMTPGEMLGKIAVPPDLAGNVYLQETYGSKDWNIVHIFRYYRGYYTGAVRDLFPQTTESEAGLSEFLAADGGGSLTSKAQTALGQGKLEWALRIADDALVLNPNDADAKKTKGDAMLQLAAGTMNSQARNMLLSDYLLMTGQNHTKLVFGNPECGWRGIQNGAVELMPIDDLHRILAVNLNASKAVPKDRPAVNRLVGLQLTDVKKNDPNRPAHYTFNVREGILEVNPPGAGSEEFVINTDTMTWKNLVLYNLDPKTAVETEGKVTISGGSPESFYVFMDLFKYDYPPELTCPPKP
jgi:alkyl sulfatase BDS1-like metallo-beta-lactamase superfamily hydrolase